MPLYARRTELTPLCLHLLPFPQLLLYMRYNCCLRVTITPGATTIVVAIYLLPRFAFGWGELTGALTNPLFGRLPAVPTAKSPQPGSGAAPKLRSHQFWFLLIWGGRRLP